MAMKNVPLFKPALAIAVRQYINNSYQSEEDIYLSLEQCSHPYNTYVSDYMDKTHPLKGYIVYGIHQTETVATLMDKIDRLIDDITSTIETFQNPPPESNNEDFE